SGGERQRVALGRAIVRKPQVFLFDEPLSNLDAKLRVQMRAEISALHKRLQITTIYVTHDQVEAMTMGERITVLNGGKIQQVDEPLNLYNMPTNRFVAEFIGSPPMNLMSLEKKDGAFQYAGHALPLTGEKGAPGSSAPPLDTVLAGIRPEHVDVAVNGGGLPAKVVLVEPMGGETIVYLALEDDTRLVAKIDGMRRFTLGETLTVTFDRQQIHWFDPRTERRISL
ncbi:MAG: TOBE domain-containing protein, partial [Gemmatimonadetes bacterium]|nr:TOBE domain-containing protein [Gemmatimonadota bacterium]